jgi:hypothetical protein
VSTKPKDTTIYIFYIINFTYSISKACTLHNPIDETYQSYVILTMRNHSVTNKRKRGDTRAAAAAAAAAGGGNVTTISPSTDEEEHHKENKRRRTKENCDDKYDITGAIDRSSDDDSKSENPGYVSSVTSRKRSNAFHKRTITDENTSRRNCEGYTSTLNAAEASTIQQRIHSGEKNKDDRNMYKHGDVHHTPMKEMYKKKPVTFSRDGDGKNRTLSYQSVSRRMTPIGLSQNDIFLASLKPDKEPQQNEEDLKVVAVNEKRDIISQEENDNQNGNDEIYGRGIHPTYVDKSPRLSSSTILCWWIYRSFCIFVIMILVFLACSTYVAYVDSSLVMKDVLQDELQKLQEEINHLLIQQEAIQKVLQQTEGELQQSQVEVTSCQNRLIDARKEGEKLDTTVTLLRERLESMVGTDDTIQASLRTAWDNVEEFKKQKMNLETLLEKKTLQLREERLAKDDLNVELRHCSERIIELEFDSMAKLNIVEEMKSLVDKSQRDKDEIQKKLYEHQDLVALLQHQLDEENGHSWFHEMQIQYLESVQAELEGLLNDSKYEISKLKNENVKLRQYLSEQGREAVAALNAVAKSATHYKAEQMANLETSTERLIQGVKNEAANAINYVVSTMFRRSDSTETSEKDPV